MAAGAEAEDEAEPALRGLACIDKNSGSTCSSSRGRAAVDQCRRVKCEAETQGVLVALGHELDAYFASIALQQHCIRDDHLTAKQTGATAFWLRTTAKRDRPGSFVGGPAQRRS